MTREQFAPAARRRADLIRVSSVAALLGAFVAIAAQNGVQAQDTPRISTRCEMSPEEFAKFYRPLIDWIQTTLTESAHLAHTIGSRGFSRLPLYFAEQTLASTKVVLADPLPMPPLSSMGLVRFAEFERGDFDGITYMDTIFLKPAQSNNEITHFHELVHVIQWGLLGPDRFLWSYANGLECSGYRQSPLEAMAYDAETAFASSMTPFNVEKIVAEKLGL